MDNHKAKAANIRKGKKKPCAPILGGNVTGNGAISAMWIKHFEV